jgi:hypothetical protein
MKPWDRHEIEAARSVPFHVLLRYLGAYCKQDRTYKSHSQNDSVRVHVSYGGRDFTLVFAGEKWVNELLPPDHRVRGGGGAIDLAAHLTGMNFVCSVKVCLDANAAQGKP